MEEMPQVLKKTWQHFGLSLPPDKEVAFCRRDIGMAGGPRYLGLSRPNPAMTDQVVHLGGRVARPSGGRRETKWAERRIASSAVLRELSQELWAHMFFTKGCAARGRRWDARS